MRSRFPLDSVGGSEKNRFCGSEMSRLLKKMRQQALVASQ